MAITIPLIIVVATVVLMGLGAIVDDRRARLRRREQQEVVRIELPLLHSINDDRCIGCEGCVDACPTEVLELVDHKVRVVRFNDCVQCEQCANACPTTALVMYREGTTPRTLTVPELDDKFQTGVPGQYLIGEVAGKPLVKNAANLGRAVIEHIAKDLAAAPRPADAGIVDVAIVGSGPGGLSAGLTCLKKQLSCVVLEKEHVISSTVSRYPKGKHFMAEPSTDKNVSYLPVFDATKEELVAAWQKVVEGVKLPVKLGEAVETVKRGDDGIFTIKTTVATYRARTVVLATGLRGKPRLLAVPGANLEKVGSLLDDPAEFAGEHVLVVGGGDSAVEGAMSLADVGATVTLSYRGDGFKRCKQGNQKRLAEMTEASKMTVLLESNVKEFTPDAVTIKLKDGTSTTIPNQHAFVLIGADTPVTWLEANNVRFVEREHLYALGSTEEAVRRVAPDAAACPSTPEAAVAIVLGQDVVPQKPQKPQKPPRKATQLPVPKPRRESVVAQLGHELREAVSELTGVFRIPDALPSRPARARTKPGFATEPTKLVPVERAPERPRMFANQRLVSRPPGFVPESTKPMGKVLVSDRTVPTMRALVSDRTAPTGEPFIPENTSPTGRTFASENTAIGVGPFGPETTAIGESAFGAESTSPTVKSFASERTSPTVRSFASERTAISGNPFMAERTEVAARPGAPAAPAALMPPPPAPRAAARGQAGAMPPPPAPNPPDRK